MSDNAVISLLPSHYFSTFSTFVSLASFLIWLFYSPYIALVDAEGLDRKLGCYYAVNLVGNALMLGLYSFGCTSNQEQADIMFLIASALTFGVSIIGTNILSHRYMLEKANIMVKLINEDEDPSIQWLAKLESSLVWEIRSLGMVVLGCVALPFSNAAAEVITGLASIVVVLMDSAFSAMITAVFLRPVMRVLSDGGRSMRKAEGYKKLQQTKRMTLAGTVLTVASSSLLYINIFLQMTAGIPEEGSVFWSSPWLNPVVFGINLDSVLNDLGMLLACGVLKNILCTSVAFKKRFSMTPVHSVLPAPAPQPTGAYAEPSMVFASQGDDEQMD